jgi:hypothetical protein
VIDEQHHHGADGGDEDRIEVEAADAGRAEAREQEAADEGADDAKQQVHDDAAAGAVHKLAGDEPGDEAQDDPGENRHERFSERAGFETLFAPGRCSHKTLAGLAVPLWSSLIGWAQPLP